MDGFTVNCPICYELPTAEIYQCTYGHIVCSTCSVGLRLCPQCREQYGNRKIRARVLEELIGGQVECANKQLGCKVKVPRRYLSQHVSECRYGEVDVQLCKYMGYSCLHTINSRTTRDTVDHFVKMHGAMEKPGCHGTIQLENFLGTNFEGTNFWSPFICDNAKFLVFAKNVGGSGGISLNCVHLEESSTTKYLIQFKVWKDEAHILSYEVPPIRYADMKTGSFTPPVLIDVNVMKENYLVKGCLQFNFCIRPVTAENVLNSLSSNSENVWIARNRSEIGTASVPSTTSTTTREHTFEYVWTVKNFYAVRKNVASPIKEKYLIELGPESKCPSRWEIGLNVIKDNRSAYLGFDCKLAKNNSRFEVISVKVKLHTVSTAGVDVNFGLLEDSFEENNCRRTSSGSYIWKLYQPRNCRHVIQSDGSVNFVITFTVEKLFPTYEDYIFR